MHHCLHCLHCGKQPALATNENQCGFSCVACGVQGGWHLTKGVAEEWWNRLNEEHQRCLGCGSQPKLFYVVEDDELEWVFQCTHPNCAFYPLPHEDLQAALSSWYRCNRAGDAHIEKLWTERHYQLFPHLYQENTNEDT